MWQLFSTFETFNEKKRKFSRIFTSLLSQNRNDKYKSIYLVKQFVKLPIARYKRKFICRVRMLFTEVLAREEFR